MKTHNRPNVTQAMSILRLQYHWTLQEIADIFGVTREAIRLRVGNTGHLPPLLVDAEEVFARVLEPKSPAKATTATFNTMASLLEGRSIHGNFIMDGFGNIWPAKCPACSGRMSVVRPGKVQCENCG